MKFLEPFYYKEFKCVGGKCIDTCCQGWQVIIDKKSFLKYRNVKGEFGKKLNKVIKRNRKNPTEQRYGKFILENRKCQLLNDEGLCDLFINQGESSLCDTCTNYPRVSTAFAKHSLIEKNLNLSCPEVARKFVEYKGKFNFILTEGVDKDLYIGHKIYNYNENLYDMLWECRSFAIDIVQLSELPLYKRLILLMFLEGRVQKLIDSNNISDYGKVLDEFENEISSFALMKEITQVNNCIKIQLISNIVKQRSITNKNIQGIGESLVNFVDGKTIDKIQEELNEKGMKFNEYIKNREYIFENYMVYLLYRNFMLSIVDKNLHKEIIVIMIEYACTKLLLMVKWMENDEELLDEDFVKVLYSISKILEHSPNFTTEIYEWIVEKKFDTPGYLTTLIY